VEAGEGPFIVGFGAAALSLGVLILTLGRPKLIGSVALVLFLSAAGIVTYSWVVGHIGQGLFGCPIAGTGSGIYLSWIGAAIGFVGGLLPGLRDV
jgi:hypothetical protein